MARMKTIISCLGIFLEPSGYLDSQTDLLDLRFQKRNPGLKLFHVEFQDRSLDSISFAPRGWVVRVAWSLTFQSMPCRGSCCAPQENLNLQCSMLSFLPFYTTSSRYIVELSGYLGSIHTKVSHRICLHCRFGPSHTRKRCAAADRSEMAAVLCQGLMLSSLGFMTALQSLAAYSVTRKG